MKQNYKSFKTIILKYIFKIRVLFNVLLELCLKSEAAQSLVWSNLKIRLKATQQIKNFSNPQVKLKFEIN